MNNNMIWPRTAIWNGTAELRGFPDFHSMTFMNSDTMAAEGNEDEKK